MTKKKRKNRIWITRFIPKRSHRAIREGRSKLLIDDALAKASRIAIASSRQIYFPRGRYNVTTPVKLLP